MKRHDLALDKVIAILVLCTGIAAIAASLMLEHYGIHLPLIISISSLLYLLFRGKLSQIESLPKFGETNRIRSINHIFFIISLSLSIWVLWSNLFYRPPLYFALLLVAAASIMLDIFSLNEDKSSHISIPLFKIIALSLLTYAGMYYQFPGIYGVDPWLHNMWIQETVNLGHLTTGESITIGQYYLFPVFYLTSAITQILTLLPTYDSIFASIGVLMAVSCLFVFLIGRRLFNAKIGLLAALIVPFTASSIERATAIIPMSLGFVFFLTILYLVFPRDEKGSLKYGVLIMLVSVSLVLTHTIAALVTLLSLIAVFTGIKWYKQVSKPAIVYGGVSLTMITFFGVIMLLSWMQNPLGATSFLDLTYQKLLSSLQLESQFLLTTSSAPTIVPYAVSLLNEAGYFLLLPFGIIGALLCFPRQNRTGQRMALVLVTSVLVALPYAFILFNVEGNILPGRWLTFMYVPLSILAIQGLLGVSNLIRASLGKLSLIMIVILAILLLMTTINSTANDDSPFLYNNAARSGYTESEIRAIKTLSHMDAGHPETDLYYGSIFSFVIGRDVYSEMLEQDSDVFILRNYYLHHPEWDEKYTARIRKVGPRIYEPMKVLIFDYLKEQGIDRGKVIYRNGRVSVYAVPGTRLE